MIKEIKYRISYWKERWSYKYISTWKILYYIVIFLLGLGLVLGETFFLCIVMKLDFLDTLIKLIIRIGFISLWLGLITLVLYIHNNR
ncbi:hypothetical protein HNQ37_000492 [Lactovum miscens]|uniref:Uncharacterized protein n=1 Tax=Lactovum miscens TaxID=190387 RepID=A0A841C8S0_9LACT|nr:hypothetical protein [Lactovum miscens]